MQNDSGMSDYPLGVLCRCQASEQNDENGRECAWQEMEVTRCRDARWAGLFEKDICVVNSAV